MTSATIRKPGSILFLCGLNCIRSPMAEVIARAVLPQGIFIQSAGVTAGERDPFVESVLEEKGYSLGTHEPRSVDDIDEAFFDLVVTLSPEAQNRALEMGKYQSIDIEYWPMPDPSVATGSRAAILDAYRDVRDRLEKRIRAFPWIGTAEAS